MHELTLYTNPLSRGAIVDWLLREIGAPYKTEIIEYGEQMNSPDYLAIHPMGKVPALRHKGPHGEHIITECAAICTYLTELFPKSGLGPQPSERADYYRWLFFAAGPLEYATFNQYLEIKLTEEQEQMAGYGSMKRVTEALVNWFTTRDYVCANRFTTADILLGSQIIWGLYFALLPEEPALTAYAERLTTRPAAEASGVDPASKELEGAE